MLAPWVTGFPVVSMGPGWRTVVVAQAAPDDLATVTDSKATVEARSAACRRLLATKGENGWRTLLPLLESGAKNSDLASIVVRELGQMPCAPVEFLAPLEAMLKETSPEKQAAIYRAIGSIRTREAAKLLVSYAGPSATSENRDAIMQSLIRLTGRMDVASDREAWAAWVASTEGMTEAQWTEMLSNGLAQRADTLRAQRDDALKRLVESERARFVATTEAKGRSQILAGLLKDEVPQLRRLGIELTNRELANARELTPEVGAASIDLLKDPAAEVRAAGADLIDRLIPSGAAVAVREALAKEQDPNVLAKLLRQAKRYPTVASSEAVMGFLGADAALRRAAIDAAAAMQAAGLLDSPIDLARALQTLRSEPAEELSLEGLKLRCELGDDSDRAEVARLLSSASAEKRLHAAQALSVYGAYVDAIVTAAAADPALFPAAAAAVAANRPTLEGLKAIQKLPQPTPATYRESVIAVCSRMDVKELVKAALETKDLDLREAMLARVVGPTPAGQPAAGAGDAKSVCDAVCLLAETQLEANKAGAALASLESLNAEVASKMDPTHMDSLKTRALLFLDRLDDAIELNAPAVAWLEGLEMSVDQPQALAIAAEIASRFASTLSTPDRERLATLTTRAKRPRTADNR